MELTFTIADPAGNITFLVTTPVPSDNYASLAASLLEHQELGGEQVGYITAPKSGGVIRLEMMGGEFCGNALRSTAMYYASQINLKELSSFPIEISGCNIPLTVTVDPANGQVTASMPIPERFVPYSMLNEKGTAVCLPGIVHCVIYTDRDMMDISPEIIRSCLRKMCTDFSCPASGVMFYNPINQSLRPAVYVESTDSLFFENSCASGSTATAACLAHSSGDSVIHCVLHQPGGDIETVASVENGAITSITIGGKVTLSESITLVV